MINEQYILPDWMTAENISSREGVGDSLVELGEINEEIVVLTADLAGSVKVREFAEMYPERFFDVGVAEQNLMGVAAGLSFEGYKPIVASYASFCPGRNWEQIRVSVCMPKANVVIVGSHAGVATGVNGPSHQATEDIALMRVLPNMKVIVPADYNQAKSAIAMACQTEGPIYIRVTRPDVPVFTKPGPFELGKAYVYRSGKDVTICACGIQVYDSLMVAEELSKEGIECEVINVSSIKPLDFKTILASGNKTGKIITIEDHQIAGGLGSAVAEQLAELGICKLKRIGIKDRFGYSGEWREVYKKFGLDIPSLKKAVVDWLHE